MYVNLSTVYTCTKVLHPASLSELKVKVNFLKFTFTFKETLKSVSLVLSVSFKTIIILNQIFLLKKECFFLSLRKTKVLKSQYITGGWVNNEYQLGQKISVLERDRSSCMKACDDHDDCMAALWYSKRYNMGKS